MIDKQKLCKFLVRAKKATYAAGDGAEEIKEKDQSKTLIFKEDDLKYHDNYFGGEPFGGREVVFEKDQPIYIMTYYGLVDESVTDFKAVYKVLQSALLLIPEDHPFRGPKEHVEKYLKYQNKYQGEIDDFSGEETITDSKGKIIYRAKYSGGYICQRSE